MKNYPAIKVFELWQFSRNFTTTEEIEFLNTIWPTHFLKNGISVCVLFRKMQTKWKPWMLENFNFKFPVWYVCFFLTEKLSPLQLYVGLLRMWNSLASFWRGSNTFTFLTLAANNLTYIFLKNNFWHRFSEKLSWLHVELFVGKVQIYVSV